MGYSLSSPRGTRGRQPPSTFFRFLGFSLILRFFWCEDSGGLGDRLTLFGILLNVSFLYLSWCSLSWHESTDGLRLTTSVSARNKGSMYIQSWCSFIKQQIQFNTDLPWMTIPVPLWWVHWQMKGMWSFQLSGVQPTWWGLASENAGSRWRYWLVWNDPRCMLYKIE